MAGIACLGCRRHEGAAGAPTLLGRRLPLVVVVALVPFVGAAASGGVLLAAASDAGASGDMLDLPQASASARSLSSEFAANTAYLQPVLMSSTAVPGSLMTDGDIGQDSVLGKGCAQTEKQPDPWARIDFGVEVPTAVVTLFTRNDTSSTALGPLEIYVGNTPFNWLMNDPCATGISMSRSGGSVVTCLATGRYIFIVLRARGLRSSPLSLCEVQVTPKGPMGTKQVFQTIGEMWNLELKGIAMSQNDRIRIVEHIVVCGRRGASTMAEAVLDLSSPIGERHSGTYHDEVWEDILLTKMGLYKVCWCGAVQDCTLDEHFNMHVATIVINGIITTVGGTGVTPDSQPLIDGGAPSLSVPLNSPYGLAVTEDKIFVSERDSHLLRYYDLLTDQVFRLAGQSHFGIAGDFGKASKAELFRPLGIGLSFDRRVLFVADSGSHRIRAIQLNMDPLSDGIITTVAGNGYRGFSGDGGPATAAQLSDPACVVADTIGLLWVCDRGNNRLRVVSLGRALLVPGTSDYRSNIILTAAGNGLDGLVGDVGNGRLASEAQLGGPSAVALASVYINDQFGILSSNIYVAEQFANAIRSIGLDFGTYMGTISAALGSRTQGNYLQEGVQGADLQAMLDAPQGLATDNGLIWVSDTANHRIVMLPRPEYVSLGCWRENTEAPWIPLVEDNPVVRVFLDGVPETRVDAIWKCALAALRLGNIAFAIRRTGACATGPDAYITFTNEGASTSCGNGLGGSRDNSVYMFSSTGSMVEQLGILYNMVGRDSTASFGGDGNTAWTARLNGPTGIAVSPVFKDIVIADTNNHRVRLIFSQLGPNRGHQVQCSNGQPCVVVLEGNGFRGDNQLGLMFVDSECGKDGVRLASGFEINPVRIMASGSHRQARFDLGTPGVTKVGYFRLCFCIAGSAIRGVTTGCGKATDFIYDAGTLEIIGPNGRRQISSRSGTPFEIPVIGAVMSQADRIRIVDDGQKCGEWGAEQVSPNVTTLDLVNGGRSFGNETYSMWSGVEIHAAGKYTVCWCRGSKEGGGYNPCKMSVEFAFEAALLDISGPIKHHVELPMTTAGVQIVLKGYGFSATDRIRIVDESVPCGSPQAVYFSSAVSQAALPWSMAARITAESLSWEGLIILRSGILLVCWCGNSGGCTEGQDYNVEAMTIQPVGPITTPFPKTYVAGVGDQFDLTIDGYKFKADGTERITLISEFDQCGTLYAAAMSSEVVSLAPRGAATTSSSNELLYRNVRIKTAGLYKICYCECASGPGTCCEVGEEFFTEIGAIFVNISITYYNGAQLGQDKSYVGMEDKVMLLPRNISFFNISIPKDTPRLVKVDLKTRSEPPHAGSVGPILIRVTSPEGKLFPFPVKFENLPTGGNSSQSVVINLKDKMALGGIMVQNLGNDAWFCDYIDVAIEMVGRMRFACVGWTASEPDPLTRLITEESLVYAPTLAVAMWDSRYFQVDVCPGCPLGYACVQEQMPEALRIIRQERDLSSFVPVFHGECRAVCGDSYLVPGEQCDDGNVRSLDGCSADCQVEQGFECTLFKLQASKCYPRFCDYFNGYDIQYSDDLYAKGESLGYMCSARVPATDGPPVDKPYMCYPWVNGVCPLGKSGGDLTAYIFSPPAGLGKVDCSPFALEYIGSSMDCNESSFWSGRAGYDAYSSYSDCEDQCKMDSRCGGVQFYINTKAGGKMCAAALTSEDCGARCRLVHSCANPVTVQHLSNSDLPTDMYYVGRKVLRSAADIGGDFFCSQLKPPRPVWAYEIHGNILVQMDSPTAPPAKVAFGEAFNCSLLLSQDSYSDVSGSDAECRWLDPFVLRVTLGVLSVIGRPLPTDNEGQIFGNPSVLLFDSWKLKALGVTMDFPAEDNRLVEIYVRRDDHYSAAQAGMPVVPVVMTRGPQMLGGCGSLEVTADISSGSKSRRFSKASWKCMQVQADMQVSSEWRAQIYDACTQVIQPLLDKKPWCGPVISQQDQAAMERGIARPCELRVVIPPSGWCGMRRLSLQVELTTVDGQKATSVISTVIRYGVRMPTVASVGQTEYVISPQRVPGAPLPRVHLEVTTAGDIDSDSGGDCACNVSIAGPNDGSEAKVVVEWYYGLVLPDGSDPPLYAMNRVTNNEAPLMNVLHMPLDGTLLIPGTSLVFFARAVYAKFATDEGALVRFLVKIKDIEPPLVSLRAPSRVCASSCGFLVDASESTLLELIAATGRRLQGTGSSSREELVFAWDCIQLKSRFDDAKAFELGLNMQNDLTHFCEFHTDDNIFFTPLVPGFNGAEQALPAGLYIIRVTVSNSLYPDVKASKSVTIEVLDEVATPCGPVLGVTSPGPEPILNQGIVQFEQMGFGLACPAVSASTGGTALLLLRAVVGRPISDLEAVAELSLVLSSSTRTFPDLGSQVVRILKSTVPQSMLSQGFVYRFRLLVNDASMGGEEELQEYKQALLAAGPGALGFGANASMAAKRVVLREPLAPPRSVFVHESDIFSIKGGPTAGSFVLLQPSAGKAFAMQDMFKFLQLWATNDPPLVFAYFYGAVAEERRADFKKAVAMGFDDSGAAARLRALVPEGLVLFSTWARDPTLAVPLPVGMYVFEGQAMDATGMISSKLLAVESLPPWTDTAETAKEVLLQFEMYLNSSRFAMLQVQASNRGPVAVPTIYNALKGLPDLTQFDFSSMVEWHQGLGTPSPMSTQAIYGVPIVSKELRGTTISYIDDIINMVEDIINTLDEFSILALARPLEMSASTPRRLQTADNRTTSHVEILTRIILDISVRIHPLNEDILAARVASLVTLLLSRIRDVKAHIAQNQAVVQNLLATLAKLLAMTAPIVKPRGGSIQVNVSGTPQAILSVQLLEGLSLFGDAIAAFADLNEVVSFSAKLPLYADVPTGGGDLEVTVKTYSLNEVVKNGIKILPDKQAQDRWGYPEIIIKPLGEPGFLARDWAGQEFSASTYSGTNCYGATESFLDRITLFLVSWPISPVRYSSGTLVDIGLNISVPYTVQLRSCGKGIALSDMQGQVTMLFLLDPQVVRERRFGYGDLSPYRVNWWEDIPASYGSTADRVRRWTTQGCTTYYDRSLQDEVRAVCDRLPQPTSGSIFAVELVQQPPYILEDVTTFTSLHNICSYVVILLLLRFILLYGLAYYRDFNFWPSEHDLVKIYFVPAEYRWKEDLNKRREAPSMGLFGPLKDSINALVGSLVDATKTALGDASAVTLEVRELQAMRDGERDAVYENFFDAISSDTAKVERRIDDIKMAALTMQREQRKMIALAYDPAQLPDKGNSRQASLAIGGGSSDLLVTQQLSLADAHAQAQQLEMELMEDDDIPMLTLHPGRSRSFEGHNMVPVGAPYAEMEDNVPELPPGWEVLEHEGSEYYHNKRSGQTTWFRPMLLSDGTVRIGNEIARGKPKARMDAAGNKVKLGTLRGRGGIHSDHERSYSSRDRVSTAPMGRHGALPPFGEDMESSPSAHRGRDVCAAPHVQKFHHNFRAEAYHSAPFPRQDMSGRMSESGSEDEDEDTDGRAVRLQVQMAAEAAARSLEVILPYGWDLHVADDGREFYINDRAGITQWNVPRLPPHYEERISSDGRVYYVNLWNKTTQWEWPQETSPEMTTLAALPSSTMPMPNASNAMMALPNSIVDGVTFDDDHQSDTTAETSVAGMADQLGVEAFLALSPELQIQNYDFNEDALARTANGFRQLADSDETPGQPETQEKSRKDGELEPWGINPSEEKWIHIKENLKSLKRAHEARFETAKATPGLRDFIRPHELDDQPHNWEAQFTDAQMKTDLLRRRKMVLGMRAELRKPELRNLFPIIQRLIWTKWAAWQIFGNASERASPTWNIYMNEARPSKAHRCLLYIMQMSCVLMVSTIALAVGAPVNEKRVAEDVAVWTLFAELAQAPWDVIPFIMGAFAVVAGWCCHVGCRRMFFAYIVSADRLVTSKTGQLEILMYWHDLVQMGKWVCLVVTLVTLAGTVAVCAVAPQARAVAVIRTYIIAWLWVDIVYPLLSALITTIVLVTARNNKVFDGLLSAFPGIMNFETVGVVNPDFLRWRVERIVTELEQMKMLYRAEDKDEFANFPQTGMFANQPHLVHMENTRSLEGDALALQDAM